MINRVVQDERYYRWLISFIKSEHYDNRKYSKLLHHLYSTDFLYYNTMDSNRAIDGEELRLLYAYNYPDRSFLENENENDPPQCSILEMMIALAIRMERDIMYDEELGDRTEFWFWEMVRSLGLIDCTDDNYDVNYICEVIENFLFRNNSPNGRGGLFTVDDIDIRDMDIWYQMQHYLNYIIERRLI